MRNYGHCENCQESFEYNIYHSGFGDCSYAYCDTCGMTSILSMWDKRWPKLPPGYLHHREICPDFEPFIRPCTCGGSFKKGASPRCPHCRRVLSAEAATSFIEKNAKGTKKGWRWQRNWTDTYCIVIDDKLV